MGEKSAKPQKFEIKIDREHFTIDASTITGADLRSLPEPDIGPDRDLFLTVPGPGDDELIDLEEAVELKNGMHFFTAPSTINPGGNARSA